jgi:hypothetical protein
MSQRRAKRQRQQTRRATPAQPAPAVDTSMPQRYEVLHYPGDLTGAEQMQPGRILGHDELCRPYEVLDAEYDPATGRTAVHLQYASTENLRAELERRRAS